MQGYLFFGLLSFALNKMNFICLFCFRLLAVSAAFLMRFFCSLLPYRWPHNEGRKLHRADTLLSAPKEADNVSLTAQSAHRAAFSWHRTTRNVSPPLYYTNVTHIDSYIYTHTLNAEPTALIAQREASVECRAQGSV